MLGRRKIPRFSQYSVQLILILVSLTVTIFLITSRGWSPVAAFPHPDPGIFVAKSMRIAQTGELILYQDPPLRYLPLVVVYMALSPPPGIAERLAALYATTWTYALTPVTGYLLLRIHSSRIYATIGTTGMVIGYWVMVIPSGLTGPWQFAVSLPYAYTALYAGSRALRANDRKWTLSTGLLLGITALTQILVAGFAALVIALTYASETKFRKLAATALTSIITASPLVLLSRLPKHSSIYLANEIIGDQTRVAIAQGAGPLGLAASFVSVSQLLAALSSTGFWTWTVLTLAAAVISFRWQRTHKSGQILFVTFLSALGLWLAWSLLTLGYIGAKILLITAPLTVAVVVAGISLKSLQRYNSVTE